MTTKEDWVDPPEHPINDNIGAVVDDKVLIRVDWHWAGSDEDRDMRVEDVWAGFDGQDLMLEGFNFASGQILCIPLTSIALAISETTPV